MPNGRGHKNGSPVVTGYGQYHKHHHFSSNWVRILIKTMLCLAIIFGLVLIGINAYSLFANPIGSILNTTIFLSECGIWIWLVILIRKPKYRYNRPDFKIVFSIVLGIVLICSFAGIKPLSTYKNQLFTSYQKQSEKLVEENKENTEQNRIEVENGIFSLINQARTMNGLQPLERSALMDNLTLEHSKYMSQFNICDHSGFEIRAAKIGNKTVAENVAQGYYTANGFVQGWLNSTGHRDNIMMPRLRYTGIGYINGCATQLFSD